MRFTKYNPRVIFNQKKDNIKQHTTPILCYNMCRYI